MLQFYVAVLARNSEGVTFVTVPDLPGVNSAAPTVSNAVKLALEFANDYVRDLVEEGHKVPEARELGDIPVDPEDQEVGRVILPVDVPGKSVKISISIDEALLARIDRAADVIGLTRSGFIAMSSAERCRSVGTAIGISGATVDGSFDQPVMFIDPVAYRWPGGGPGYYQDAFGHRHPIYGAPGRGRAVPDKVFYNAGYGPQVYGGEALHVVSDGKGKFVLKRGNQVVGRGESAADVFGFEHKGS